MNTYLPKMISVVIITIFAFFSYKVAAQTNSLSRYKINSKGFVENKGQITDQNLNSNLAVKYLFSNPGFNVQLRQNGFSYDTYTKTAYDTATQNSPVHKYKELPKDFTLNYHRVDVELLGCNLNAEIIAEERSDAYYNYFTAGTKQGGTSNVHSYQKVVYKDIYPHIDLEFMSSLKAGSVPVEYQFIVHVGGNPGNIKLAYKGANNISLNKGQLVINVAAGNFTESIPSCYLTDNHQAVKVNYASLGSNIFTFSLPSNFDLTSDLVIDPVPSLLWGTYYGGANDDEAYAIAVDADSNVYITGFASSTSGIATTGAYQVTFGGSYDAFVAKLNPSATSLIWGTYYGGSGDDEAYGIAVDANKNVYISGYTSSATGMASSGAYQTTNGGSYDAFAAKFNSAGTSLIWGTYYGGTGSDGANGIAIDASNNVYITGRTNSLNAIATSGVYQTANAGGFDAFVAKFNPGLSGASQLVWGTYYGGTSRDEANGIVLDASKNVYLTGGTSSTTGIATLGSYNTICGANGNAFISKFDSAGKTLIWGTYYGGPGSSQGGDVAHAITLDPSNNIFITGTAGSTTGIATPNAYDTSYGIQGRTTFWEAFIAKFNPGGTSLLYGTYYGAGNCSLGGPPLIPPYFDGYGIATDVNGNVFITGDINIGMCQIINMVTPNAYQLNINVAEGGSYCYVAKFDPTLSTLVWGTYYGGSGDDYGYGIAVNKPGTDIYVTGLTDSPDGIATTGTYQTSIITNATNAFAAKFNAPTSGLTVSALASPASFCAGGNDTLTASGANTYTWAPSTGLSATTGSVVIANPTTTTTYTVTGTTSSVSATAIVIVTVNPAPTIITSPNPVSYCSGGSTIITASGGISYTWVPSAGLNITSGSMVTANPTVTTTYIVTGTDLLGCTANDTDVVTVILPPNKPTITVSVTGDSLISSADSYNQWYFNDNPIQDSTRQVLVIKGHARGWYTVTVTNPANGCSNTSDSTTSINHLPNISNQLSIFPNPSSGQFTIKSGDNQKGFSLEVYNVVGEEIYQSILFDSQTTIDLSTKPSGMYFIYLKSEENVEVGKILISR